MRSSGVIREEVKVISIVKTEKYTVAKYILSKHAPVQSW